MQKTEQKVASKEYMTTIEKSTKHESGTLGTLEKSSVCYASAIYAQCPFMLSFAYIASPADIGCWGGQNTSVFSEYRAFHAYFATLLQMLDAEVNERERLFLAKNNYSTFNE